MEELLTVSSYCHNWQYGHGVSEAATADTSGIPDTRIGKEPQGLPSVAAQGARGSREDDDGEPREIS